MFACLVQIYLSLVRNPISQPTRAGNVLGVGATTPMPVNNLSISFVDSALCVVRVALYRNRMLECVTIEQSIRYYATCWIEVGISCLGFYEY